MESSSSCSGDDGYRIYPVTAVTLNNASDYRVNGLGLGLWVRYSPFVG